MQVWRHRSVGDGHNLRMHPGSQARDPVGRLARVAGVMLLVGVVALLVSEAWQAALAVTALSMICFGVAWVRLRGHV